MGCGDWNAGKKPQLETELKYVHTYGGSEATRVAEISQRESGLFPGQKPDGCSSNREKTQEGEQYSTPRVENAFRKTSQSCEILWEEEEVGGQSR